MGKFIKNFTPNQSILIYQNYIYIAIFHKYKPKINNIMNLKRIHLIIGAVVFLTELIILFLTVQPSVSFWDCGELSAASSALEVTHPPGAPFFILVNHILSLIPFAANIGFRINTVTVIASSFSVLFCYLVAVRLINIWRGKEKNPADQVVTYITAAIGAMSFGFANSFWFNATESNVFGFSTFLYTLMIWLMMVWYEKADQKGADRLLLIVAFILGLSPGVHLMSVLAAVTFGMIYCYRRIFNNDQDTIQSGYIFLINAGVLLVYALFRWSQETSTQPPTRDEYRAFDFNFQIVMLVITIIIMAIFYKKVFKRSSFYWAFIVGFFLNLAIYPGMVKKFPEFIILIGGNNLATNIAILFIFIGILFGIAYWAHKEKFHTLYLGAVCVVLAVLGFSIYSYIIIRANQHPPMNENDPQDVKTLVSYLSREQYGDFPTFKRRFSGDSQHQIMWAKDPQTGKPNYASDLDYFWNWQINHMYVRYLLWKYIGREAWQQDAGWTFNQLYGIPFLLGLIGLFYHFRRNWKMASVFLTAFIFMGFMICFYQNQQQVQPRDREYFYSGSWFVFSIWIAIGLRGIYEDILLSAGNLNKGKYAGYALLILGFLFIPANMLRTNYHQEDRSKNWVPWDYAYNLLQSCAPNAILFTCGDNDTFPLWYLQDVEHFRTDVRIANLSLINTDWYIKELKYDTPYGTPRVPISLSDDQIDQYKESGAVPWETKTVDVPVTKNVYDEFGVKDTSMTKAGKISFTLSPAFQVYNQQGKKINCIRLQDAMVKDIVITNKWVRPIYFAALCSEDNKIGLDDYLRLEGLAQRLVPYKLDSASSERNVDTTKCNANMLGPDAVPSQQYQPGFLLRSFNDPSIFMDENQERISYGYRSAYIQLASYYTNLGNNPMAIKVLNTLEQRIPRSHVDMPYWLKYNEATIYLRAGESNEFKKLYDEIEKETLKKIADNPKAISRYDNPYLLLKSIYELAGDYDKEINILRQLEAVYGGKSAEIENEINRIAMIRDSSKLKK